jgi:hypothetical protein
MAAEQEKPHWWLVNPEFAGCIMTGRSALPLADQRSLKHFAFEPFPKSSDHSEKRAVHYPPPRFPKKAPLPPGGVFVLVRGWSAGPLTRRNHFPGVTKPA